jgi:hypothetical protein
VCARFAIGWDPESIALGGDSPKSANSSLGAIYLGPRIIAFHSKLDRRTDTAGGSNLQLRRRQSAPDFQVFATPPLGGQRSRVWPRRPVPRCSRVVVEEAVDRAIPPSARSRIDLIKCPRADLITHIQVRIITSTSCNKTHIIVSASGAASARLMRLKGFQLRRPEEGVPTSCHHDPPSP